MQKAELERLLALTAVRLAPGQESAFLEYFTGMKKMFDEFYEFPLPEDMEFDQEGSLIACFDQ